MRLHVHRFGAEDGPPLVFLHGIGGQGTRGRQVSDALGAATQDVRELGNLAPPKALRDAHYPGAKQLGHGKGYIYPHDDPAGFEIDYLPDELKGRRYFEPRE